MIAASTEDPADLFLALYDRLGDDPFHAEEGVVKWRRDRWVRARADAIREEVLGSARVSRKSTREILKAGDRGVFAILVGLDEALEYADPHRGTAAGSEYLGEILMRYAEYGRLNSDPGDGLLLFRLAFPGRPAGQPTRDDYFGLVRVSAETAAQSDFRPLFNHVDLDYQRPHSGPAGDLPVGCVPMLASYDELDIQPRDDNGVRRYRLTPRKELGDRVESVLRALDKSGAVVGVLPEATLSDELLEIWEETILRVPAPSDGRLRWILVGTGPVGGAEPPYNRAVMLHRGTGERMLEYDKQFDFTLSSGQLKWWKLNAHLGSEKAVEDITTGRSLVVRESSLGRIGILICEDVTRLAELGHYICEFGLSHVFVPVFSAPIRTRGWETASGKNLMWPTGAWVVVSNSLAVARAMGKTGAVGTCCCVGPSSRARDDWSAHSEVRRSRLPETVSLVTVSGGNLYRFVDVVG